MMTNDTLDGGIPAAECNLLIDAIVLVSAVPV